MNWNQTTAALFLDVEKAFDRIWHEALIVKMHRQNIIIQLVQLLASYLQQRTFRVRVNEAHSSIKQINAGVPQGSLISPILYNLYTADLPKLEKSEIAQYADDTLIYSKSFQPENAARKLQEDVNKFFTWCKIWKLKINHQKSVPILFSKRISTNTTPIHLENNFIEWKKSAKYLGIILDNNLNFTEHIKSIKKKTSQLIGFLYPLIARKSKLSVINKLKIYETIIKPSLIYGIEIWHNTCNSHIASLQRIQNKTLRQAIDAPWYIRNDNIHKETNSNTIRKEIEISKEKTKERVNAHMNDLMRMIPEKHSEIYTRYRMPLD